MPKQDELNLKDMAAMFGWALSVLKSDPGLARVFRQATSGPTAPWSRERFQAEVRNTRWFKTHSDSARAADILRRTDPATWKARVSSTAASVQDMAEAMGANISGTVRGNIVRNVLTFGWSDAQIQNVLAQAVKPNRAGVYAGQAALNVDHVRQVASNYGVKLADHSVRDWASRMAAGEAVATFDAYLKGVAISSFPGWADEIKAGRSVREIADPYVQQMAATLELNPEQVDLFDPTLRKALQDNDGKGNFMAKPLWQFEVELKKDARYDATKQARTQSAQLEGAIGQLFGATG